MEVQLAPQSAPMPGQAVRVLLCMLYLLFVLENFLPGRRKIDPLWPQLRGFASRILSAAAGIFYQAPLKIALCFTEDFYPHSRLISIIIQCQQIVDARGGVLAVIHPGRVFHDVAESTDLSSMIKIFDSVDNLH